MKERYITLYNKSLVKQIRKQVKKKKENKFYINPCTSTNSCITILYTCLLVQSNKEGKPGILSKAGKSFKLWTFPLIQPLPLPLPSLPFSLCDCRQDPNVYSTKLSFICDIVIYNIHLVIVLFVGTELPQLLEFPKLWEW